MKLENARILLTGAAGGIGAEIARQLAQAGAGLALADRNEDAINALGQELRGRGTTAHALAADLSTHDGRRRLVTQAQGCLGGLDALVNAAGLLDFVPFDQESAESIERLLQVNLLAPIALTREVLPLLLRQKAGRIVNIGSTFGSIGFPYFAAYSASKFGLRGFSQALRRELAGSGIGMTYVAPRATRTALNTGPVVRMNEALKVAMDPPELVAAAVVQAMRNDRDDVYLGWPERLFVRLNALIPSVVDGALRKQQAVMRRFALER